jgi:hypothetical protein
MMKIDNPFPRAANVRYECRPSNVIGVVGFCDFLEVPEGTCEVLIQVVNEGRSNAKEVYASRIWSKEWGTLGVDDHLKKMKIEEEIEALKVEKEKDAKRKAKEARERGQGTKNEPKVEKFEPSLDMGKELEL